MEITTLIELLRQPLGDTMSYGSWIMTGAIATFCGMTLMYSYLNNGDDE